MCNNEHQNSNVLDAFFTNRVNRSDPISRKYLVETGAWRDELQANAESLKVIVKKAKRGQLSNYETKIEL